MFEEEDKKIGLAFHWDPVIKGYICERCGAIRISSANMIKHILEHLKDQEGGGDANRR